MVEIREEATSQPENSGSGDASNASNTTRPRVSIYVSFIIVFIDLDINNRII